MAKIAQLFLNSFKQLNKRDGIQMAAALSYFTLFATAPILIISISILETFLSNAETQTTLLTQADTLMGPYVADILDSVIKNLTKNPPTQNNVTGIISFLLLLITSTSVIQQLQKSLNKLWEVNEEHITVAMRVQKRLLALIFLMLLSIIITLSFLINSLIRYLELYIMLDFTAYYYISNLVTFLTIALLFFLIYRYLPDTHIRSRDVIPGALFTGIAFVIGRSIIGSYLGHISYSTIYGAAGSILGFLAWIYYSYLVFFFGAAFTYIYAKEHGRGVHSLKHVN